MYGDDWMKGTFQLAGKYRRYEQKPECLIITFNYLAKVDT